MVTRLLALGLTAGLGLGGLLGQSGAVPFDWASLVGGAIGSSPAAVVLAWRLNKADKTITAKEAELREVHEKTIQMVERMAPLIGDATKTLTELKAGMEASSARPGELDRALAKIDALTSEIERDRRRRRDETQDR